ncbi:MAG: hypothetical protein Q8K27_01360 [Betaproteobacteria bacterium]|nr:hypothetical protein [Betaproteobacteria bacterium]
MKSQPLGAFGLAVELLGTFPGLTQQQGLALMHAANAEAFP